MKRAHEEAQNSKSKEIIKLSGGADHDNAERYRPLLRDQFCVSAAVLGAAQDFSANAIEVAYQQARKSLYDLHAKLLSKKEKEKKSKREQINDQCWS